MEINRRKFVQSTSLGMLGLLIPANTYSNILSVDKKLSQKNLGKRLKIAADIRKGGNINRAKRKFKSIIIDYPNDIRGYDGLRKTLLQSKYQELKVLNLYEKGFSINPDNKDFKERLAKEYMRLILGNKKFTSQHNNPENLLKKARRFFKQLKEDYPDRKEYADLLDKVKRKIKQNADTEDARKNIALKAYKKKQKKQFRKRFDKKTDQQIQDKLQILLERPKNHPRNKAVKELYNILIRRNKLNKNFENAFIYALALYNFDISDSKSIQKAKRFALKTENYVALVSISKQNHSQQKTFWSKLSLLDSHIKKYRKTKQGNISQIQTLLSELNNEANDPQQLIEVKERFVRVSFLNKSLNEAKNNLIDFGKLLSNTKNCHLSLRFNTLLARYYAKKREYTKALEIIKLALKQPNAVNISEGELSEFAIYVNQEVTITKEVHKKRLNQLLTKLQNKQTV